MLFRWRRCTKRSSWTYLSTRAWGANMTALSWRRWCKWHCYVLSSSLVTGPKCQRWSGCWKAMGLQSGGRRHNTLSHTNSRCPSSPSAAATLTWRMTRRCWCKQWNFLGRDDTIGDGLRQEVFSSCFPVEYVNTTKWSNWCCILSEIEADLNQLNCTKIKKRAQPSLGMVHYYIYRLCNCW